MTSTLGKWVLNSNSVYTVDATLTDKDNQLHGTHFNYGVIFSGDESTSPDDICQHPYLLLGDKTLRMCGEKQIWFDEKGELCIQLAEEGLPHDFAHIRIWHDSWKSK